MGVLEVLILVSCTCWIDGRYSVWEKGNADGLFDTIVSRVKRLDALASRIRPLRLNAFTFEHGKISEIEIYGFDSFSRAGSVTATLEDERMVLEGDVGFWDIRFFGHLEHPVLNIEGNFLIIEPHVRCRVRLTFSVNKIYLNYFEILHLGHFEVRGVPGFGSLNFLTRGFAQEKLRSYYPTIRSELERNIEKRLALGLRSFNPFGTACRLFEEVLEDDI